MKYIKFGLSITHYLIEDYSSGCLLAVCSSLRSLKDRVQDFINTGHDVVIRPILEKSCYFAKDYYDFNFSSFDLKDYVYEKKSR